MANGGHGATGANGDGHRPTAGEALMRRIARIEAEVDMIRQRQRAADGLSERLAVLEAQMAFVWGAFEAKKEAVAAVRADLQEVRNRLVSILLMITSGAAAIIGAIVLKSLGLV